VTERMEADTSLAGGATVYAKDLDRVSRFYQEVCELQLAESGDDFVALERGPIQLVVVRIPEKFAQTIEIALPPQRREDTALKLMFVVRSIADARHAAVRLGGVIDGAGKEWEFRGMRVCDGHDPEGNVLQLRESAP